ncbi:M56 family metallopeptidase [Tsuneonella amylolytica]|uniref:M56 family metallopeptidase n=1 Tax=Tsuneonella amylolytica TaxID=2338327 RepID=UPI000EA87281|nr:M56 family metallopeptidase [Tsuneonella amylolytica]
MIWLVDTLVWTGAFIALALLARRPVARHFGARAAYALWALPLVRLVLPPIELPASFAPLVKPLPMAPVAPALEVSYVASTGVIEAPAAIVPSVESIWPTILFAIWLGGAAIYLVTRLAAYFRLRDTLLASARTVGEAGTVRFVETPATLSPIAFGVIDRVVALPPGFMASPDRAARDLALAHELAHHRAGDLAANFAALPLFALHWFNPLSWLGWRAMRRDQEAACDARVIANRGRAERATYASVIARAATTAPRGGFQPSLAAPMACPVLGDASIVDRLRTLTMTDPTIRRRRAGMLLIGAAALALPLTASISYAADEAPVPPAPPEAPQAPPVVPSAPSAPAAPLPPEAPYAPQPGESRIVVEGTSPDGSARERSVTVIRTTGAEQAPQRRLIEMRDHVPHGLEPDSPEFERHMKRMERDLERMGREIERSVRIDERRIAAVAARASASALAAADHAKIAAMAAARAPRVVEDCEGTQSVRESRSADGKRVIRICHSGKGQALSSLRHARASIASNRDMPEQARAEVLAELEAEIAELEAGN